MTCCKLISMLRLVGSAIYRLRNKYKSSNAIHMYSPFSDMGTCLTFLPSSWIIFKVCDANLRAYKQTHGTGKRSLTICTACCSGTGCNQNDTCQNLLKGKSIYLTWLSQIQNTLIISLHKSKQTTSCLNGSIAYCNRIF